MDFRLVQRLNFHFAEVLWLPYYQAQAYGGRFLGFRSVGIALESVCVSTCTMRRMRGVLATTAIAGATTGAALTYAFLATTRPPAPPSHPYEFSPPPELPSSSKLLIPNINLAFLPDPDVRPSRCDYGPLYECIVNGNGGCEALEQDLRNCLDRVGEPELEPARVGTSQCDYAPLWECIVNGNGGCEVLEKELRNCLEKSEKGN